MSKNSKAYREAAEKVDKTKLYTPLEAAKLAKETSSKKQDATVEVAIRLGVDPRKADQMVRGTVNLPHGTGKTARVAVFAVGDKAEQAKAAGADIVGSDDLIQRIEGGFLDTTRGVRRWQHGVYGPFGGKRGSDAEGVGQRRQQRLDRRQLRHPAA